MIFFDPTRRSGSRVATAEQVVSDRLQFVHGSSLYGCSGLGFLFAASVESEEGLTSLLVVSTSPFVSWPTTIPPMQRIWNRSVRDAKGLGINAPPENRKP